MRFCVECGRDSEHTVNGMCMECFLRDRRLVSMPPHVDLNVCTECGQFQRHGEWVPMGLDRAVRQAARETLECVKEGRIVGTEAHVDARDGYNYQVDIACDVEIGGFVTVGSASTMVRVKNTVCRICSRRTGNYYESILQIRGTGKSPETDLMDEALARVEGLVDAAAMTDANAFITRMEIVPGGVDVYMSLIALGRACSKALADQYCAETAESSKLVGQTRDGLDMYRVSYLVRLPDFAAGDVVEFRKRPYVLRRVSSQGARLLSLRDFREMPVKRRDVPGIRLLVRRKDAEEAVVVSRSAGEIQVLDPVSYGTLDLRVPESAEIGESVPVIRLDGALHFIPVTK